MRVAIEMLLDLRRNEGFLSVTLFASSAPVDSNRDIPFHFEHNWLA
jgi:hypothetical protein